MNRALRQNPSIFRSHPPGLWALGLISFFFCFGFCMVNVSLVLYTQTVFHMPTKNTYLLSASYNSLLFTTPLLGGYLAEHFGYLRSMLLGAILGVIGIALLSVPMASPFYFGLSLFVVATAFFVPSLYVMVGKLYAKDDPKRESGYTLQYILMNLGFFLAAIFSGYLHTWFNYSHTFLFSSAITLLALPCYFITKKHIQPASGRITQAKLKFSIAKIWLVMFAAATLMFSLIAVILQHPKQYDIFIFAIAILISVMLIVAACKMSKVARNKLLAFLILCYFSIGFWALYNLEPSLLTVFIRDLVHKSFLGQNIPAESFYSLDALFVIVFGGILSYFWLYLERIKRNPSLPMKFSMSLLIMSSGFFLLVVAIMIAGPHGLINPYFIIGTYFLLAIAELMISPIGTSMVGRLSPEGMEGRLMGVWQLFTGVAGALAGLLAQWAVIPKHVQASAGHAIYQSAFSKIGAMTLIIGLLALIARPYILRLISSK